MAKTVADYKAISLNLMHADLKVTDQVYAVLSTDDVKDRIMRLGKSEPPSAVPATNGAQTIDVSSIVEALKQMGLVVAQPTPADVAPSAAPITPQPTKAQRRSGGTQSSPKGRKAK